MTDPALTPLTPRSFILPLLVWLVTQLLAIAIGAGGVALSAKTQSPAESLSVQVMLVTQIAASALLWPMLFGDVRTSAVVIVSSWPFMQAAGFLSATPMAVLFPAAAMATLWMLTLAALPCASERITLRFCLRVVVALWAVGGAIANYLRAEFSITAHSFALGPITQTLLCLRGEHRTTDWVLDLILLAAAIALRAFTSKRSTTT